MDGDVLHKRFYISAFCLILYGLLLTGCQGSPQESAVSPVTDSPTTLSAEKENPSADVPGTARTTVETPLLPESDSSEIYGNETVSLDASGASKGYLLLDYQGSADKIKLQIKTPEGTVYSYPLAAGRLRSFPFTAGSGSYQISVLEHAYDDLYAIAFSQEITVQLEDEFLPFLYPNQFCWYDGGSLAVEKGKEISRTSSNDLHYLEQVYLWVIQNITYDNEKAEAVTSEYVPDVDDTLKTRKGICFDYASLMVAMLRSQQIPTRLEVGYSGQVYHAWISVYLKEYGWVDDIIEFDGTSWTLMDPTLASNNDKKSVGKYVGDGSNYTVKYHY
ncbi:MAG: transglutaminase domain-containing protein [Lachnospiraceae bacterium]|nr:transglutaminase domain-containing protein [Lachnospiraceae bacterium]